MPKIVNRSFWLAEPPTDKNPLSLPVPNVILLETSSSSCHDKPACVLLVRHTQTNHKEGHSKWDIGYNFLIGGDGNVYQGRGWDVIGSHTFDWDDKSLGIAFLGTFKKKTPTDVQIEVAKKLIKAGVQMGYIKKDYNLYGGTDIGESLEKMLSTWEHWAKKL